MTAAGSQVTLRAHTPKSLADPEVRRNVIAAAHALGERMGVAVTQLTAEDGALRATVVGSQIVATGFAAELRRSTEKWHVARYGAPLWHGGT